LRNNGIESHRLYKIHQQQEPTVLNCFREQKVDLAINIVDQHIQKEVDDDYQMRRHAIDHNIPLITKVKQARLFARALTMKDLATIPIKSWREYGEEEM
jgi:carbamoyl-phosphate synthase large subunit